MKHIFRGDGRRAQRLRVAKVLILVTLLASLYGSVPPQTQAGTSVEPRLMQMAQTHPDTKLGVIVQKSSSSKEAEALTASLGGKVTKDLHIINAFSAEMTGKAVMELAKNGNVRRISSDGNTHQTSGPTTFTTWATDFGNIPSTQKSSNFNSSPIPSGRYIWFSSTIKPSGVSGRAVKLFVDESTVQFVAGGSTYTVSVPSAIVSYDPTATTSSTTFDAVNNSWLTTVPASYGGNTFMAAIGFGVPTDLPGGINPVTWTTRVSCDTAGISANWQWAAATYTSLGSDLSALGVKPIDNSTSQYNNSDKAGTPENYKSSLVAGGRSDGGTGTGDYVGSYSGGTSAQVTTVFNNAPNMIDSALGADATYASGSIARGYFTGFSAEATSGNAITRVEVALVAYIPALLSTHDDPLVGVTVNGVAGSNVTLNHQALNAFVGPSNVSTIYLDLTNTRTWRWSDFDGDMVLKIDQSGFNSGHNVYYDAVGLRVTSDSGADASGGTTSALLPKGGFDTSHLVNAYNSTVRAPQVWNEAPALVQGEGVGVAVVDSGLYRTKDLEGRVVANVNFNAAYHSYSDGYGHGTFVSGIIAGNGKYSNGSYVGIAPRADIINVRVSDDQGMSTESDVVAGLQWVLQNKDRYNIRVVNMSLNSSAAQSYHTSPLDAAAEVLWFNGIVVVVSSGNSGTANLLPPANDPFVITVGATNDMNSVFMGDDTVAPYSAYGVDETGTAKPDLVAPGTNIIALLPRHGPLTLSRTHTENRVSVNYFRMSGTSMAAPVVAGAVALLLEDEPNLTPDQVKYRLKATAISNPSRWPGYNPTRAGAGYLDTYAAVHGTTTLGSNNGLPASQLLWTGNTPITWGSVNWNSVNWNSVNWNSVNWNSVNWNSVNWNSDAWNQ